MAKKLTGNNPFLQMDAKKKEEQEARLDFFYKEVVVRTVVFLHPPHHQHQHQYQQRQQKKKKKKIREKEN